MRKRMQKLRYFDRAPGALTGYLQGTPPAENPPIQRNYTQGALQDRENAEIGCVIGREHARARCQHASGASGPGRILSILGRVEKSLFFRWRFGASKKQKNRAVERQRVAKLDPVIRRG